MLQDELGLSPAPLTRNTTEYIIGDHIDISSKQVKWRDWLTIAWTNKLCLVDWPDTVPSPGPGFSIKALTAGQLKIIVAPFLARADINEEQQVPCIVRWSTSMSLPVMRDGC